MRKNKWFDFLEIVVFPIQGFHVMNFERNERKSSCITKDKDNKIGVVVLTRTFAKNVVALCKTK